MNDDTRIAISDTLVALVVIIVVFISGYFFHDAIYSKEIEIGSQIKQYNQKISNGWLPTDQNLCEKLISIPVAKENDAK